jgi:hypothetical protein
MCFGVMLWCDALDSVAVRVQMGSSSGDVGPFTGKTDYEYMDPLNRPITVIAHSTNPPSPPPSAKCAPSSFQETGTLHVTNHTSHYATRHAVDETAIIVASMQVLSEVT